MPGAHLGSTSVVDPGSQEVIPRQFKRKKKIVRTNGYTAIWTDGRACRNRDKHESILIRIPSGVGLSIKIFLKIASWLKNLQFHIQWQNIDFRKILFNAQKPKSTWFYY